MFSLPKDYLFHYTTLQADCLWGRNENKFIINLKLSPQNQDWIDEESKTISCALYHEMWLRLQQYFQFPFQSFSSGFHFLLTTNI